MAIQCNELLTRARDGVKIYTRFSHAYYYAPEGKWASEIPEGADPADYHLHFYGKLRCDQTGELFETAHDVEGSERTYTEVFPDLSRASTIEITSNAINLRYHDYPEWDPAKTYAKGDIVVFQTGLEPYRTIVSDFDDNLGCNTAYGWGWSTLMPIAVDHSDEIEYKTIEEWEAAE